MRPSVQTARTRLRQRGRRAIGHSACDLRRHATWATRQEARIGPAVALPPPTCQLAGLSEAPAAPCRNGGLPPAYHGVACRGGRTGLGRDGTCGAGGLCWPRAERVEVLELDVWIRHSTARGWAAGVLMPCLGRARRRNVPPLRAAQVRDPPGSNACGQAHPFRSIPPMANSDAAPTHRPPPSKTCPPRHRRGLVYCPRLAC